MTDWRTIDSLPLCTEVLVFHPENGMCVINARNRYWREMFEYTDDEPTHWMPLPDEPGVLPQ